MDFCYRRWRWVKPSLFASLGPTHAFAGEFDAVRVVDEAVEDGVGMGCSPMISRHRSIGSWEVITVERGHMRLRPPGSSEKSQKRSDVDVSPLRPLNGRLGRIMSLALGACECLRTA
jgi:hypothetical protein